VFKTHTHFCFTCADVQHLKLIMIQTKQTNKQKKTWNRLPPQK